MKYGCFPRSVLTLAYYGFGNEMLGRSLTTAYYFEPTFSCLFAFIVGCTEHFGAVVALQPLSSRAKHQRLVVQYAPQCVPHPRCEYLFPAQPAVGHRLYG
jgi:hypothetical protein